ncbi:MAG TPA: RNA polymerase sporulation sigma factor SigE, partial [Clostridia bacterium]|nr:RNA polymerase sporulation sigma factor SigE [Clostridia bacterium]
MKRLIQWLSRLLFRKPKGIWYVGSGETLPPPLSAEEEQEWILRLSNGDAAAPRLLIERNLRLVVYIARKFENTGVCIEDLISIGTIGLIKAVNTFDAKKKIKLATYASRCIENEILMHLRRTCRLKMEVSLDEPLNIDWDGNELLLSDILGTDCDIIERGIEDEVDRELLLSALKKLTPREQHIVELRFGLNTEKECTQKQVADILGISQSYISRLEKRIIKRLRKEML